MRIILLVLLILLFINNYYSVLVKLDFSDQEKIDLVGMQTTNTGDIASHLLFICSRKNIASKRKTGLRVLLKLGEGGGTVFLVASGFS
jgi:hypothetical protein